LLALTLDDGPDPMGTPVVLEALARAGVRATFFVLGGRVVRHPGLLGDVIAAGHAVEVHGFGHLRHPEQSRAEVERDLVATLEVLGQHGVRPVWWRAPWGHLADFTPELADAHGLRLAGWTLDSHDWRGDTAEEMLAVLEPRMAPGGVVLAHDGVGDGARRGTAQETARLIGPLVAAAREKGLELGPLWPSAAVPPGNPELHASVASGT
jgi:peptidoglycan/xylan/chitin deacetylase (PgdA/CDA1 family)